jgi:hypothetical protein
MLRLAAGLSVLLALAGCAAVTAADGRRFGLASDEFRTYVETVFRAQNETASELAFAIEDADTPPPALSSAEDSLLEACAGLNELATSRRDGQKIGMRRSAEIARKAPDCERATAAARAALAAAKP